METCRGSLEKGSRLSDRSEGEGVQGKEARRVCRGRGTNRLLGHAGEAGFLKFFSEDSGELWSIFNQGVR